MDHFSCFKSRRDPRVSLGFIGWHWKTFLNIFPSRVSLRSVSTNDNGSLSMLQKWKILQKFGFCTELAPVRYRSIFTFSGWSPWEEVPLLRDTTGSSLSLLKVASFYVYLSSTALIAHQNGQKITKKNFRFSGERSNNVAHSNILIENGKIPHS